MEQRVVDLHRKYCTSELVTVVWIVLIATALLQVLLVASAQ